MWLWLVLLALIVFFMYWWGAGKKVSGGSECGACTRRKNMEAVE